MNPPDPVEQLTEPQRECLRLVLAHYSSKEIAQRLGVSPSAVDKRIERAVQLLGASSRFEAARRLAAHEGRAEGSTSDPIASDPIDVAEEERASEETAWPAPSDIPPEPTATPSSPRPRIAWSWRRRLAAMALLTFGFAAALLVLLGAAGELAELFSRNPELRRSLEP